jgi:hypothetical protein
VRAGRPAGPGRFRGNRLGRRTAPQCLADRRRPRRIGDGNWQRLRWSNRACIYVGRRGCPGTGESHAPQRHVFRVPGAATAGRWEPHPERDRGHWARKCAGAVCQHLAHAFAHPNSISHADAATDGHPNSVTGAHTTTDRQPNSFTHADAATDSHPNQYPARASISYTRPGGADAGRLSGAPS